METTQAPAAGRVPAFRPALGRAEARALSHALKSGWIGTGIYTRLFEARFAAFAGGARAAAVNSGTAALHLALEAAGARGGEVVTTPLTNVATSHAILHAGAVPVFCDVDPERGLLDPAAVAAALTPRTRAVVAVHLHGHPCDMDALLAVAARRRVPVIEDCCQAVAGSYKGRPLGTLGTAGCFSFGRFKTPTTVDGGVILYEDPAWERRLGRLRRLGHEAEGRGFAQGPGSMPELGWHCRMNDLAAALGLAQLERWPALRAHLAALAARYRAALASSGAYLRLPADAPWAKSGWSHLPARVPGGRGPALERHLRARGVDTEAWLYPNHLYKLYRPYRRRLPVAERLWKEYVYLPFSPGLTDAEADRVVEAVRSFKG